MSLGASVRRLMGRHEKTIAEAYRRFFVDLDDLAAYLKVQVPDDELTIAEVGCGEGMFTSRLDISYPRSEIIGIDVIKETGRMFQGDFRHVSFKQQNIDDFSSGYFQKIDLIIVVDVLHHIPKDKQRNFLLTLKKILKPQKGKILIKDWVENVGLRHMLAYFSDRFITGDHVYYRTNEEWCDLFEDVFGRGSIKHQQNIRPGASNAAFLIQPSK